MLFPGTYVNSMKRLGKSDLGRDFATILRAMAKSAVLTPAKCEHCRDKHPHRVDWNSNDGRVMHTTTNFRYTVTIICKPFHFSW
jgi:hypothetical protein